MLNKKTNCSNNKRSKEHGVEVTENLVTEETEGHDNRSKVNKTK